MIIIIIIMIISIIIIIIIISIIIIIIIITSIDCHKCNGDSIGDNYRNDVISSPLGIISSNPH